MSETNGTAQPKAAEPVPLPTPSPIFYQELANEIVAAISRAIESVPDFGNPVLPEEVVKRKPYVRAPFVDGAVRALLTVPDAQKTPNLNAAQALDDRQYVEAFKLVRNHLLAMARNVGRLINARQARLNIEAVKIYDFTRAFAHDEGNPAAAHVVLLKQARRRNNRTAARSKRATVPDTDPVR